MLCKKYFGINSYKGGNFYTSPTDWWFYNSTLFLYVKYNTGKGYGYSDGIKDQQYYNYTIDGDTLIINTSAINKANNKKINITYEFTLEKETGNYIFSNRNEYYE